MLLQGDGLQVKCEGGRAERSGHGCRLLEKLRLGRRDRREGRKGTFGGGGTIKGSVVAKKRWVSAQSTGKGRAELGCRGYGGS